MSIKPTSFRLLKTFMYTTACLLSAITIQARQADCSGLSCDITISSDNSGTISVSNGDQVCFTGGTFTGSIALPKDASLCIGEDVTFSPSSFSTHNQTVSVDLYGTWNTSNTLNTTGTLTMSADNFNIYSGASFTHEGSMTTSNASIITSNGATTFHVNDMTNQTSLTICGPTDVQFGDFASTGTSGTTYKDINPVYVTGSYSNAGTGGLTLESTSLVIEGDFINQAFVTGGGSSADCAQITVGGDSENTGGGVFGVGNSYIDICDNGNPGGFFDTNSGSTSSNATSCSCFNNPLPIDIVDFYAKEEQGYVSLHWQTASESNNSYFDIQKSTDEESFYSIGMVKGHGNSSTLQTYSYKDHELIGSTSYYRLKQIDTDQRYSYSPVISILATGYPSGYIWLDKQQKLRISNHRLLKNLKIYNGLGQKVYEKNNAFNTAILDLSVLNKGIYIVKLELVGKGVVSKKILIP